MHWVGERHPAPTGFVIGAWLPVPALVAAGGNPWPELGEQVAVISAGACIADLAG